MEASVDAGVTGLIAVGVDLARSRDAVAMAHRHAEVWAAVGHYPLETSPLAIGALEGLVKDERVVAVGEIGLDYPSADERERARQLENFDALLTLAVRSDLPVSIHNRGASEEVEAAIKRHRGLSGAMHYFALEWDWAERFLDLGFYLSFAGLVTRPSRTGLREVVKRCPADRLLLETDSPHGQAHKRMGVANRPAFLLDTAELVAELRGITAEELGALETENALRLFRRMR